ncbi:MAG: hypothetical protein PUB27_02825 [Firmicutes bacterium]|nr:hypothetical protein [Bacillota bacterium]
MGDRSGFLLYHLLNYRLVLIFIFRRLFELANHLCRVPGNKNALRFLAVCRTVLGGRNAHDGFENTVKMIDFFNPETNRFTEQFEAPGLCRTATLAPDGTIWFAVGEKLYRL